MRTSGKVQSLMSLPYYPFCLVFLHITLFMAMGYELSLAQNIVELSVDPTQFKESYDPKVQVSGGAIVGIRLGNSHENIQIKDVRLPAFAGNKVCVRAVTQDGRFSSNNIYKANGIIPPNSTVRISPVANIYAEQLSSYKMDAFALNAFVSAGENCAPEQALHLPQLLANPNNPQTLYVVINSGGRFSNITIVGSADKSLCSKVVDGARIAYDTICPCDVSKYKSTTVNMVVTMDDGFAEEKVAFKVLIP